MTGFIVMAIGLATMSFADRYSTLVIGGLVFGIGSGLQEITTIYLAGREAGHHTTMAMSFALMSVHLGVTLSPIVINTIKYLLGLNSAASAMRIGAAGFSVLAAVELFRCRSFSKRREHPAMP
jgi:MFS family permease